MQLQSTQTWIFWIRSTKRRIYAHHTLMWAQWANKRGQRVQSAAGDLPQPTCLWRQTCRRMSNIWIHDIALERNALWHTAHCPCQRYPKKRHPNHPIHPHVIRAGNSNSENREIYGVRLATCRVLKKFRRMAIWPGALIWWFQCLMHVVCA